MGRGQAPEGVACLGVTLAMRNVELKLELRDIALARSILRTLGATHAGRLEQTDTYYKVADGRFKRRECPGGPPEYIAYQRADAARPRVSDYTLYTEAQAIERFGARPQPVWVVVRKSRELFLRGNVRIHLDRVEGLSDFLEFEAVISNDWDISRCQGAIRDLRTALAPALGEPVSVGYAELVAAQNERAERRDPSR
jgi:adenylate cyclase class IV